MSGAVSELKVYPLPLEGHPGFVCLQILLLLASDPVLPAVPDKNRTCLHKAERDISGCTILP